MGVKPSTYCHHENGTRDFDSAAARYARFFDVSLDWLLTGSGPKRGAQFRIVVLGLVGAGASVELLERADEGAKADSVAFPPLDRIAALRVVGDSQFPRFLDGEIVLFDPDPVKPETLVGRYAIVQTLDGRRLIKTLRRGKGENRWRLESHNAPPEDDVRLMGAWRYLGLLHGGDTEN